MTRFRRRSFWTPLLLAATLTGVRSAPALEGLELDGTKFRLRTGARAVEGILVKPEGAGPFPAIVVSHGLGSNAESFGGQKAREFVRRGYVCIAPTYTHSAGGAGGRPAGKGKTGKPAPGGRPAAGGDFGGSPENLNRAADCLDVLESLPYVDKDRLYLYGNSMGAFVTVGLSAQEGGRVAAAAITAGGVNEVPGFPAPPIAEAEKIRVPILMLHGTADTTVPPAKSELLAGVLKRNGVPHERKLFEGVGHNLHQERSDEVFNLIDGWFKAQRRD